MMFVAVVLENKYYSYTLTGETEKELKQKVQEDKQRFLRWRKAWGVVIPITKTYLFYGEHKSIEVV